MGVESVGGRKCGGVQSVGGVESVGRYKVWGGRKCGEVQSVGGRKCGGSGVYYLVKDLVGVGKEISITYPSNHLGFSRIILEIQALSQTPGYLFENPGVSGRVSGIINYRVCTYAHATF